MTCNPLPGGATIRFVSRFGLASVNNFLQSVADLSFELKFAHICRSMLVNVLSASAGAAPRGGKTVSMTSILLPGSIAGNRFRIIRTAYLSDQFRSTLRMTYTSAFVVCGVKKSCGWKETRSLSSVGKAASNCGSNSA